ncbi:MAG: ABC transporter substrate-binding protein [Candidatus Baldrarchaeia archaeon]
MKITKIAILLFLIGIVAGASIGYGVFSYITSTTSPSSITIRVGILPLLGYQTYLIEALNLTRIFPSNVKIEYKAFPDGSAQMEAFMAGQIDIGYVGTVPALKAWDQGAKCKMVAGIYIGGTVLIVRNDTGDIHTLADLKGKDIATPAPWNWQDAILKLLLLPRGGLTEDDVTIHYLKSTEAITALLKTPPDIDAAIMWEPHVTKALEQAEEAGVKLDVLVPWNQIVSDNTEFGYQYSASILIASEDFMENHPDLLKTWIEIHLLSMMMASPNMSLVGKGIIPYDKACDMINTQIKRLTGIDFTTSVIMKAFERLKWSYYPSTNTTLWIAKVMYEHNVMTHMPNYEDIHDLSIENEILQSWGLEPVPETGEPTPPGS